MRNLIGIDTVLGSELLYPPCEPTTALSPGSSVGISSVSVLRQLLGTLVYVREPQNEEREDEE